MILSILQCLQEDQDHVHVRPAPEEEAHLDVTKETIEKEIDTGTEGAEEGITENQMMAAEEAHRPEVWPRIIWRIIKKFIFVVNIFWPSTHNLN